MADQEELISSYLEHANGVASGDRDVQLSARETLADMVRTDPESAWSIVIQIIQRIHDDRVLAYVAAGPLEDLLHGYGHLLIDRVEARARSDAHFRHALTGVWGFDDVPNEIWMRIQALVSGEPPL